MEDKEVSEIRTDYCSICHPESHNRTLHSLKIEQILRNATALRDANCQCGCHTSLGEYGHYHCMGGICCSKPNKRKSGGCFGREY